MKWNQKLYSIVASCTMVLSLATGFMPVHGQEGTVAKENVTTQTEVAKNIGGVYQFC